VNARNGHFQGGGVEKVGATREHNRPRIEARGTCARGGDDSVFEVKKSSLSGGIESVRDTGGKGGSSSIYLRVHSVRDAHCRQSGSKCAVGLIEDCVR
jgi:L-rhamnose isomerase